MLGARTLAGLRLTVLAVALFSAVSFIIDGHRGRWV
jgi:hypothetical protein